MDYNIHIDKFHKIVFCKYKVRKIKPKDQTLRNLLCYYQGLVCKNYNTVDTFNTFLGKAYDMRFMVSLTTIGTYSIISYTLTAVDPKYINDDNYTYSYLEEAFNECLKPYIINNNFDLKIFKQAKEMYESNLMYSSEQEQKIATTRALNTFFNGTIRDFLPEGDLTALEKITCKRLYKYYLSIQKDEEVSFVVGNTDNNFDIKNLATMSPKRNYFFKKRGTYASFYEYPANTNQTYLEIIYDTNIFPNHKLFYAVSFINYIFGGCSNSKLFKIVREKYGLCYSIFSAHYGASGILLVSAIMDKKNVNNALSAIDEAFGKILEDINLDEIKKQFILEKKGRNDYLSSYLTDAFMDRYFLDSTSNEMEEKRILSVTKKDILTAYKKINKSLVFVYGGNENESSI